MTTYLANMENADGSVRLSGEIEFTGGGAQPVNGNNAITSGTLPQMASWVSTTAQQNPVARPVTVVLACTCDATNNAATVAIALSPNNSDYTTVATWSVAAALDNLGAIVSVIPVLLPQSWYIKLTISTHASVAQSYYY